MLAPYPEPGKRGVFEHGDVRIETDDGEVLAERKNPRAAFGGRRNLWWDDLDLLYFAGYALWGYMGAPFIFTRPGLRGRGDRAVARGRRGLAGPAGALPRRTCPPTHASSRTTSAPDGLIRRNDYTAEVFGGWAKAAHYCWDYRDFDGFKIPTRRGAMPRGPGRPAACAAITIVTIAIDDVRAAS